MLFTYTYRDNSGAVRRDCVEAGSRAEAVSLLRSRNIFPLSLKEGPKGRNAAGVSGSVGRAAARPFNRWLVICAVLGTVLAGGGLWWSMQTVPTAVPAKKPASPQKIKKTTDAKRRPVKAVKTAPVKTNIVKKAEKPKFIKKPGRLQLPDGKVLTFPPPKKGETRKVHAYGHTYVCDHLGNFKDITPRRLFHTAFEANFLNLAVEGGAFIPAFLTGLDEADVKKMLLKKYEPIGDETEEEMAKLKAYDDMRCAALEYMEQGGKFDDFVNEFAQYEKQQRQTRALGLGEVMKLVKQGKMSEAKEMAEAANLLMNQKGFKPIKLPAYVEKAFNAIPASEKQ